jgi:hypothetical protein
MAHRLEQREKKYGTLYGTPPKHEPRKLLISWRALRDDIRTRVILAEGFRIPESEATASS